MDDARDAANMDVLRRKAQVGRRAYEAHGMSPEKALNRALTRAAEVQWNLALLARNVRQMRVDQTACEAALDPEALIVLLDGPDGQPGFAAIAPALVAGLTEVQTFGTISQGEAEARAFTATDAAMTAPLLDLGLENFARLLVSHPLHRQIAEFRFGAWVEAARVAGTLMEAAFYQVFQLEVDLGGGLRTGALTLAFPERPEPVAEPDADDAAPEPRHGRLMQTLPVQLDAVLCRLTLPLATVEDLRTGSLVPLPRDALTRTELCAAGGHPVARGTLGQMNGQRALRVAGADATAMDMGAVADPRNTTATDAAPPDFHAMLKAVDEPAAQPTDPAPSDLVPPIMDLPDIPELDDLPGLSGPEGEGAIELPDLPDFPAMPDLPDIDGVIGTE